MRQHSGSIGYILWPMGLFGAHRFFFGKFISGTLYFFTFGLFGIGWFLDLFLISNFSQRAEFSHPSGPYNYNTSWILLTYFGIFGLHRFYLRKWWTGALYLCTLGLFTTGILYDFWTLNDQVAEKNRTFKGDLSL